MVKQRGKGGAEIVSATNITLLWKEPRLYGIAYSRSSGKNKLDSSGKIVARKQRHFKGYCGSAKRTKL